jgi:dienelactone hydrolase
MTIGHFMRAKNPVEVDGKSQIGSVADEDAQRLEWTRKRVSKLLDSVGRDRVVSAWPFTTQTVVPRIQAAIAKSALVAPSPQPENLKRLSPTQALGDFALGISSLLYVKDVYYGTMKLPTWLDDKTRAWRADGEHAMRDVHFTMTVPRNGKDPLPVVIFGHAIATERRFVLAVGDALAQRGFAAISIDFPFHGEQTRCVEGGLIAVPDPQTGEIRALPPCQSGFTCNDFGKCVDAQGLGNHVAQWPILNFPVASGAAFIEIEHIANTRDHFLQAVLDLNGLHRALKNADWKTGAGVRFDPAQIHYAGQSLGGIIGATFVPLDPEISRTVLNVPGSDLVDMFSNSDYFKSHVDAFFTREKIDPKSWQAARFLNLARVIVDGVDPQSVAGTMKGRPVMIQMATLDFIIPNTYTELLGRLSGAPKRDYIAEHAFIVIPVEPAFMRGQSDLGDYLAGKLVP